MNGLELPEGIAASRTLLVKLDKLFGKGFARLSSENEADLDEIASAFLGTPLGDNLASAIDAIKKSEQLPHHFAALAAAKWAIEGAQHDALFTDTASKLGFVTEEPEMNDADEASQECENRMEGARQWLFEIALSGLARLETNMIVPVVALLEGIQNLEELRGLAITLTAFIDELLDHTPTAALDDPPLQRWTDLWSSAFLATYQLPNKPTSREISGEFFPIGADLRHQEHLVSLVVHGILEEGNIRRFVRTTITAWKVDAIIGAELWGLFNKKAPALIKAVKASTSLQISNTTLLSTGDLIWKTAVTGKKFDPYTLDFSGILINPPAPQNRHSLQIAFPVNFDKIKTQDGTLDITQTSLGEIIADTITVSLDRVSPYSEYTPANLKSTTSLVGLLRFDGNWSLQPITAKRGKTNYGTAKMLTKIKKSKSSIEILQERAGKLLRAK